MNTCHVYRFLRFFFFFYLKWYFYFFCSFRYHLPPPRRWRDVSVAVRRGGGVDVSSPLPRCCANHLWTIYSKGFRHRSLSFPSKVKHERSGFFFFFLKLHLERNKTGLRGCWHVVPETNCKVEILLRASVEEMKLLTVTSPSVGAALLPLCSADLSPVCHSCLKC